MAFCTAMLCTGMSTFAGYAGTTSTLEARQDLATFGNKLGQRLAGVVQEMRTIAGTHQAASTSETATSTEQGVVVADLWTSSALPQYFTDTSTSAQSYAINLLAQKGIVAGQGGKFYPDNYIRLYDFVKMAVDLYRLRQGYTLTGGQGLSTEGLFSGDNGMPSRYVATAFSMGMLSHVTWDQDDGIMSFLRFADSKTLIQMVNNLAFISSGTVHVLPLGGQEVVTRGQAAQYLVMCFGLTPDGFITQAVNFQDIYASNYQSDIVTLANLGIIDAKANKFYPSNMLHRYDFLIMVVNTLLKEKGKTLSSVYASGYMSRLSDITPQMGYAPYVYYAEDKGITDFLIINKRGKNFLYPEQLMTQHEVYTILSQITKTNFIYDMTGADQTPMSRDQLAHLLVKVFDLRMPSNAVVQPEPVAATSTGIVGKISLFLEIKKLFSKMFA